MREADWKGTIQKRWRWTHMRFEWGCICYQVNSFGEITKRWWGWER